MLDKQTLIEIHEYVQCHLNELILAESQAPNLESFMSIYETEIDDFIKSNRKPTLHQVLFDYIDRTGLSDPEVYNRAGIDRKHFSKIRSNINYRPKKNTIIALALALELNKEDTDFLLSSAGYSLSDSDTYDLVIQFCLEKKIYNIHDVNQALDYFSLKPLVGTL